MTMKRVKMTMGSNKHTDRDWQQAYFAAAKVMPHKAALQVADKVWEAKQSSN